MKKFLFLLIFTISLSFANAQVLLQEDFDYGAADGGLVALSGGTWVNHSGTAGTLAYKATSLSMTNYPNTGVGGSVFETGAQGEDANRSFTGQTSGVVYASALMSFATTGNDNYFFHFKDNLASSAFYARVFTKDNGSGKILFGLQTSSLTGNVKNYSIDAFDLNKTYLVILKYEFATATSSLYVFDELIGRTEPTSPVVSSTGGAAAANLDAMAIRQSTGTTDVTIDGIRVAKTWAHLLSSPIISDISINPSNPTSSDAVVVSANVTDDNNSVATVKLRWGTEKGVYTGGTVDMSMPAKGTPAYQGTIPAQVDGTNVYYIIEATDANSLVSTSAEQTYTSADPNTAPEITNIMVSKETPSSSETVTVTANVADAESNLATVNLKWGKASGDYTVGTIKMVVNTAKVTNSQYITETAIPAQAENTTVYYVIEATDAKNATTTSTEKMYTVAADPNTAPAITNIVTNPTAPTSTESVLVTANVTDAESNLASVSLKWGKASGDYTVGTITMVVNTAKVTNSQYITQTAIPAQAANSTVYYVVEATDTKNATTTSTEQWYKVDPSAGIDAVKANSIRLYPNPATSVLNVSGENIKFIALANLAGQEIVSVSVIDNNTSIDVQGLESGIYFVKVTTNEGAVMVDKFIKE